MLISQLLLFLHVKLGHLIVPIKILVLAMINLAQIIRLHHIHISLVKHG